MSDALSARVESSTSVAPPLAEVALLQESGVLGLSLAGSPFSLSICLERRCRTLQSTATPWELRIGAGSEYLSRISSSATTDWFIRAASTQSRLFMVAEEQRNGVLCVWGEENGIIYVVRGFCRCQFTALLSFFFSFFLSFFCLGPHTCWRATVHFSLVSYLLSPFCVLSCSHWQRLVSLTRSCRGRINAVPVVGGDFDKCHSRSKLYFFNNF